MIQVVWIPKDPSRAFLIAYASGDPERAWDKLIEGRVGAHGTWLVEDRERHKAMFVRNGYRVVKIELREVE